MTARTLNAGSTPPDSGRVGLLAEPHLLAWIVTAIALVGYIVLAALHIHAPILDVILGGSFGSASSLSWPRRSAG